MTTLAAMLAAAQRLLSYYNGDEKTAQNPGGLTGVGGMADNWDPCIQDIGTVANGVGDAVTATSTSEGNAAASASAAAGSATAANASKLAAATSEGNAAGSATAAANSASAAAGSATAANASKLAAATSEGNAAGSATTATQQAGIATAKAGEAAGSATTATQQAGIATTKAGEAAGSASTATQKAQVAADKATEAAASAANAQTWDPTNYSRRYTLNAVGTDDWVKLGTWTAGTADRLLIELTGAFAYVPEQPGRLGGLTTITATMMADTNAGLANVAGQFAYLGNSACNAVKFVQNGANRYSYHVYISRYAYTTTTYRVLCGGTWAAVNAASQASPGAGGTATIADATARGAILTSNEAIQQNIVVLTNVGGTFTPNCNSGNEFDCGTLGAAATIASPTNVPSAGKVQPISIKWTQDGTGGRVMSFGGNCINVGGTSANTTAGKVNFAVGKVYSDGKFYYSIVRGA